MLEFRYSLPNFVQVSSSFFHYICTAHCFLIDNSYNCIDKHVEIYKSILSSEAMQIVTPEMQGLCHGSVLWRQRELGHHAIKKISLYTFICISSQIDICSCRNVRVVFLHIGVIHEYGVVSIDNKDIANNYFMFTFIFMTRLAEHIALLLRKGSNEPEFLI